MNSNANSLTVASFYCTDFFIITHEYELPSGYIESLSNCCFFKSVIPALGTSTNNKYFVVNWSMPKSAKNRYPKMTKNMSSNGLCQTSKTPTLVSFNFLEYDSGTDLFLKLYDPVVTTYIHFRFFTREARG
jgi:hypothetical protein